MSIVSVPLQWCIGSTSSLRCQYKPDFQQLHIDIFPSTDESCSVADTMKLVMKFSKRRETLVLFRNWLVSANIHHHWLGLDGITEKTCWKCDSQGTCSSWVLKLSRACTDGARTLTGRSTGCVALLGRVLLSKIWFYSHQEALCAKDLRFSRALNVIVCLISAVLVYALNHFLPMGTRGNQCLPATLVGAGKGSSKLLKIKEINEVWKARVNSWITASCLKPRIRQWTGFLHRHYILSVPHQFVYRGRTAFLWWCLMVFCFW